MADEKSTPEPSQPEPMTRERALELLRTDVKAWNQWRKEVGAWNARPSETQVELPDLSDANLSYANLSDADLRRANLRNADLRHAELSHANLNDANLSDAELGNANLSHARLNSADLGVADLGNANLGNAYLFWANLGGANLRDAVLFGANLSGANLDSSNFSGAYTAETAFGNLDLTNVHGLELIDHGGPSDVATSTLVRSRGRIPAEFLRGCGLQPWEIEAAKLYDPALTPEQINDLLHKKIFAARTGPQFLGRIFISYCHDDAKFVDKLQHRLMEDGASVWVDRYDMVAGNLEKQVDRAIRLNDVVVLALSASSVDSDWVEHELEKARKKEKTEGGDVLCPVALDDAWKAKKDDVLWRQVKKKNVLDFSEWETDAFEEPYQKLIKGLRINYPRKDDPSVA